MFKTTEHYRALVNRQFEQILPSTTNTPRHTEQSDDIMELQSQLEAS